MDAVSIIKRLVSDGTITIDEFVTLYDAIKSNTYPWIVPNTTPIITNPDLPYTITAVGDTTSISTK